MQWSEENTEMKFWFWEALDRFWTLFLARPNSFARLLSFPTCGLKFSPLSTISPSVSSSASAMFFFFPTVILTNSSSCSSFSCISAIESNDREPAASSTKSPIASNSVCVAETLLSGHACNSAYDLLHTRKVTKQQDEVVVAELKRQGKPRPRFAVIDNSVRVVLMSSHSGSPCRNLKSKWSFENKGLCRNLKFGTVCRR